MRTARLVAVLFLQAADLELVGFDPTKLLTMASQGGLAALGLYFAVWGLPKWMKDMRSEREADRIASRERQTQLVEAFQREQKYEREQCKNQFDALVAMVTRNQEATMSSLSAHHQFALQAVGQLHADHEKQIDYMRKAREGAA